MHVLWIADMEEHLRKELSACIYVISLNAEKLGVIILAHLSLTQMEWLEPTVVMDLCFFESAREAGSGTELKGNRRSVWCLWSLNCSIVSLDQREEKQLLKSPAISFPLFILLP